MKITGIITVQQHMCGVTHAKIKGLEQSLAPSANKLKKAIAKMKDLQQGGNSSSKEDDEGSTVSYHFISDNERSVALLDHIDRVGNEEAYQNKLDQYLKVCDTKIGTRNYKALPITDRLEAYKKVVNSSFTYYSYQIVIKVDYEDGDKPEFINSKKHKRLSPISEKDAHDKVRDYINHWLGTQNSDTKPVKNPSTGGKGQVISSNQEIPEERLDLF